MNSLILISPYKGGGFKPILSGKEGNHGPQGPYKNYTTDERTAISLVTSIAISDTCRETAQQEYGAGICRSRWEGLLTDTGDRL